jgi:hypothetical protein
MLGKPESKKFAVCLRGSVELSLFKNLLCSFMASLLLSLNYGSFSKQCFTKFRNSTDQRLSYGESPGAFSFKMLLTIFRAG